MYQRSILTLLLIAASGLSIAQNAYTTSPKNYRLEFENECVRVSRAMFAPGDKLPVHDHPANPTVFVYLTDGGPIRFTHVQPPFTVEREPVKEGGIRYHTGAKETHVVEYLGSTPSEYLRIELKTERPEKKTQHIRIAADDAKPFENGQIRISRFECPARTLCPPAEYPAMIVTMNNHTAAWYPAGRAFHNEAYEPSRQIRIELKTKPLTETR
jgi:hypothetical protein